jgi:hypothetical protein
MEAIMGMQEIRESRKVPAKRGMKVEVDGKSGVITSTHGGYLMVRLDGQKYRITCHPRWRFTYIHPDGRRESFGDDGKPN